MKGSSEQFVLRVMSGEARGIGASVLRGMLAMAEPVYAAAVSWRNRRFDRGKGVQHLPRPVISVGNLTAGGTGKTPVVRWLCEKLREMGRRPAILMRGYGAKAGERGDEQAMLEGYLNDAASAMSSVIVQANPSRFEGGMQVLSRDASVDVFVLDDGFQHRRLAREFDLVLIDAASPFGYGHVHPRGLLREPLRGLRRADAIVVTRSDTATEAQLASLEAQLRRWNTAAPICRASHVHTGLRVTESDGSTRVLPLDALTGRRSFAFCGIGRPEPFLRQLQALPGTVAGHRWFPDHHAYSASDAGSIAKAAETLKADVLLATEKDWVKFAPLAATISLPVWRVELSIAFREGDAARLVDQVRARTI